MKNIYNLYGNLIDFAEQGQFTAIAHGCNCFCNMGAGIAKEIKQRYPEAYKVDCSTTKGDKKKLGTYSVAHVKSRINNDLDFMILNVYTQYSFGGGIVNADYSAIRKCFRSINKDFPDIILGIPLIGAGHAKGDWKIIDKIIN